MFKNTSFIFLWVSQFFYQLGDSLYILAVVTLLYTKTHSAMIATLYPLIRAVTLLFSGVLVPYAVQKTSLRVLLVLTQVSQSLALLGLTLYLGLDGLYLPMVSIFLLVLSFLEGWSSPARSAMLPRIVEEKDLVRANSVMSTTDQVAMFIGFSSGGIAVATMGTVYSLWISFSLFCGSSLLSCFIKDPLKEVSSVQQGFGWSGLTSAWSFVYQHPVYRRLFAMDILEFMSGAVWAGAITLVFVKEILHKDETWWGFVNGSYLLGTTFGGMIVLCFSQWLKNRLKLAFIIGSANLGILTIAFALWVHPVVTLVLCFLMGIPYQLRDVAMRTLLQANADHRQLPHVFSAHQVIGNISFSLGLLILGIITEYVGSQVAYIVSAILVLISAGMVRGLSVKDRFDYN